MRSRGTTYAYTDANWGDLLTAYDGVTITHDEIGNPLSYYNGTRWTFTWEDGRQLATATDGTTSISYTYDADGIRTSKTVNGVKHTYVYASGKLLRETYGDTIIDFFYSTSGQPYALNYNGTVYYYITNLQGDVMSIVNASGAVVVNYKYDPYGNILSITGTLSDTLGEVNPLRYRGYVYDQECSLYYLQSRYYDAKIGRFINADAYASTGQGVLGYNMFAYCNNNPTNYIDPTGNASIWTQLFKDFKFGVLHILVELHILITHKHVGHLNREYNVATGRADIVNMDTGDVWEIKHGRFGYLAKRIGQAYKQASKYLGYGGISQLGPKGTFNGAFTINCAEVSYLVEYNTPDNGVIIYTVTPQPQYQTSPDYVYDSVLKNAVPVKAPSVDPMLVFAGGAMICCAVLSGYAKYLTSNSTK